MKAAALLGAAALAATLGTITMTQADEDALARWRAAGGTGFAQVARGAQADAAIDALVMGMPEAEVRTALGDPHERHVWTTSRAPESPPPAGANPAGRHGWTEGHAEMVYPIARRAPFAAHDMLVVMVDGAGAVTGWFVTDTEVWSPPR